MDVKERCAEIRKALLDLEPKFRELKQAAAVAGTVMPPPGTPIPDVHEMIANSVLAFRHVEDARMRIGKVIQAFDGGQSSYKQ